MALNPRQLAFVSEYVKDKNATRSAKAAGYSEKTAANIGHELLKKPEIERAIRKALHRINKNAELTAADVLAEIRKMAFVDLSRAFAEDGSLLHPRRMPREVRAALSSVESEEMFAGRGSDRQLIGHTKKLKIHDKIRALEMLAKHFKLLTNIVESDNRNSNQNSHTDNSKPRVILTMPSNGSEKPK